MIKALFFDIDGTLVSFTSHRVPQSAITALEQVKQQGIKIFIATGRPKLIINNIPEIEHLVDGWITANGAYCYIGEKVLCCHTIAQEDVDLILHHAELHDYACIVVGERNIAVVNYKPYVSQLFVEGLGVTNIGELGTMEMLKKQSILQLTPFMNKEQEDDLMKNLPELVPARWHPAFTDIISKEAKKGRGVEIIAEAMGWKLDELAAFGDGGNDMDMLQTVKYGIAMGNASEEVKRAAWWTTTSVDEDGVLHGLKHLNLIGS